MWARSRHIGASALVLALFAVPAMSQSTGGGSAGGGSTSAGPSRGSGMTAGRSGSPSMRAAPSNSVGSRVRTAPATPRAAAGATPRAAAGTGTTMPSTGMPSTSPGGTASGGSGTGSPGVGLPTTGVPDTIDTIGTTNPIDRSGTQDRTGSVGAVEMTPPPSMGNSSLRSPRTGVVQGSVPARATDGTSSEGTSDGTGGLSNSGVTSQMPGGVSTDSGGAASQSGASSSNSSARTANPSSGLSGDRPSSGSAYSAPALRDPTGIGGGTTSGGGRRTAGAGVTGDSSRAAYGANMQDCMSVWDASTHMTKEQWRSACARTTTRSR